MKSLHERHAELRAELEGALQMMPLSVRYLVTPRILALLELLGVMINEIEELKRGKA